MSASCIYEGTVRHRRSKPANEFTHRLAMVFVDLDELPSLLEGRLQRARPGLLRFRRRDYHGEPERPLADAVRDTVAAHTGSRPAGPVRVLAQLRSFGHCFNPVSFYYCMSADGDRLEAILTEVTNTPWGERHGYVIAAAGVPGARGKLRQGDACVAFYADAADVPSARDYSRADAVGAHREPRRGPEGVRRDAVVEAARADALLGAAADAALPAGDGARAGADLRPRGRPQARAARACIRIPGRNRRELLDRPTARLPAACAGSRSGACWWSSPTSAGGSAPGRRRRPSRFAAAALWRMLLRGSRGLADAYENGLWDSPDLVSVIRLAARERNRF